MGTSSVRASVRTGTIRRWAGAGRTRRVGEFSHSLCPLGIVGAASSPGGRERRGKSVVRYVHHQLITVAEAAAVMALAAPLAFIVHGLQPFEGGNVAGLQCVAGASALWGLSAASTRSKWLAGERGDFETAVPLTAPEAILPSPRQSLRRSFNPAFVVIAALPSLAFGLLWSPWAIGWILFLVPQRIAKGVYAYVWERRHGVLLWRGAVEEQPLAKGQFLYSSPRIATPG